MCSLPGVTLKRHIECARRASLIWVYCNDNSTCSLSEYSEILIKVVCAYVYLIFVKCCSRGGYGEIVNTAYSRLKGDVSDCDGTSVVQSGILDSRAKLQSTSSYNC